MVMYCSPWCTCYTTISTHLSRGSSRLSLKLIFLRGLNDDDDDDDDDDDGDDDDDDDDDDDGDNSALTVCLVYGDDSSGSA